MKVPEKRVYRPLMDWWVFVLLVFLVAILVCGIPLTFAFSIALPFKIITALVLLLTVIWLVDMSFFSYYVLGNGTLILGTQLKHFEVPYRNIVAVKPMGLRSLLSIGGRKRYALSTHAYCLTLKGSLWKSVTVSPVARDDFINTLLNRIDAERSSRVTVTNDKRGEKGSKHS